MGITPLIVLLAPGGCGAMPSKTHAGNFWHGSQTDSAVTLFAAVEQGKYRAPVRCGHNKTDPQKKTLTHAYKSPYTIF